MSQIKVNSIVPAAGLSGGASGGIVQTVFATKTATFSEAISSGGYTADVFTASITPQSTSNKILITGGMNVGANMNDGGTGLILVRNSTIIDDYRGPSDGSRGRVGSVGGTIHSTVEMTIPINFLDSPSTTSAITYRVRLSAFFGGGGTTDVYLNRASDNSDETYNPRSVSTMTLMEVSG